MPIDMIFPGISMGVFQARFWCEQQKRSIFAVGRRNLEEKTVAILEREFSMLVGSERSERAAPVWFVTMETWPEIQAGLPKPARAFAAACGFEPTPGRCQILPDAKGKIAGVLFGIEAADACVRDLFLPGQLATSLPCGVYHFANRPHDAALATLSWLLSGYRFQRYKTNGGDPPRLCVPEGVNAARVERVAKGVALGRDLINTPANDMDPDALEAAAFSF